MQKKLVTNEKKNEKIKRTGNPQIEIYFSATLQSPPVWNFWLAACFGFCTSPDAHVEDFQVS